MEAHKRPFLLPGDYLGDGMLLNTRNTIALYIHTQHEVCSAPMHLNLSRRIPAPFHLRLHDTHPRIGHMCMHHGLLPQKSNQTPPIWCKWTCTGCTMHLSDTGDLYLTNHSGYKKLLVWGRHNRLGGRCWSPPGVDTMQDGARGRRPPLLPLAAAIIGVAMLMLYLLRRELTKRQSRSVGCVAGDGSVEPFPDFLTLFRIHGSQ